MGNSAGASQQIIAAPKGGGAQKGIGEKFSPDLFTGTGNFTVPIALPPGRNGFQPQLNLVYSTGHGNGPFGLGWNLSVPGVSRKTWKGIPRYDDARDVFCLYSEGELPFKAQLGRRSFSVDLSGPHLKMATIEITDSEVRIFKGRYLEFDEFNFQNLRRIDGW